MPHRLIADCRCVGATCLVAQVDDTEQVPRGVRQGDEVGIVGYSQSTLRAQRDQTVFNCRLGVSLHVPSTLLLRFSA